MQGCRDNYISDLTLPILFVLDAEVTDVATATFKEVNRFNYHGIRM
jgi:hypothetical protein